MCILLNVKKHEKTFALNVDIFNVVFDLLFSLILNVICGIIASIMYSKL